jgi:hypothetical protein
MTKCIYEDNKIQKIITAQIVSIELKGKAPIKSTQFVSVHVLQ